MLIYLVTGTVNRTFYMEDKPESTEETRLVCAENTKEAEEKFEKYFEDKSIDYSVSYFVYNIEATEPII